MKRTVAAFAFIEALRGYDPLVKATQFSIQVDLVTQEPTDAGSIEQALLKALATKEFGFPGLAIVTAKTILR